MIIRLKQFSISFERACRMLTFEMALPTLMWHRKTRILTLLLMVCQWLSAAVTAWITWVGYIILIKTLITYFQTPGSILCGGTMSWWLFMWTALFTAFTLRIIICLRVICPFYTVDTLNWFTEGNTNTTGKTQSTSWMTLWNWAFPDYGMSLVDHSLNFIMFWLLSFAAYKTRPIN